MRNSGRAVRANHPLTFDVPIAQLGGTTGGADVQRVSGRVQRGGRRGRHDHLLLAGGERRGRDAQALLRAGGEAGAYRVGQGLIVVDGAHGERERG